MSPAMFDLPCRVLCFEALGVCACLANIHMRLARELVAESIMTAKMR